MCDNTLHRNTRAVQCPEYAWLGYSTVWVNAVDFSQKQTQKNGAATDCAARSQWLEEEVVFPLTLRCDCWL